MSDDRDQDQQSPSAPLLATAMANLRAASTGDGPGSQRARSGRLGGGPRERVSEQESQESTAPDS